MENKIINTELSKKERIEYCLEKEYATRMFFTASKDYVAARCCILNGLLSGFIFACQAIEKILKAFIYLDTGSKTTLKGEDLHNPLKLKEELCKVKNNSYQLDIFDNLLDILYDRYKARYPDNKVSGRGAISTELNEIDKLWVHLIKILPMPDQVKYRMRFFDDLFNEESKKYWQDFHWATESNEALSLEIGKMEKRYKELSI